MALPCNHEGCLSQARRKGLCMHHFHQAWPEHKPRVKAPADSGSALPCPICLHPKSSVNDSRPTGGRIRRRRECLKCRHRFTTFEEHREDLRFDPPPTLDALLRSLCHTLLRIPEGTLQWPPKAESDTPLPSASSTSPLAEPTLSLELTTK